MAPHGPFAAITVRPEDRAGLERLCRHVLRPPVAQDRLTLTPEGRVIVTLNSEWADGTTHLVFEPVDLPGKGAPIADVGCGAGVAVIEMAKALPRARVDGWDLSEHALARAEDNRRAAGVRDARVHDAPREPLPADARFALVTTFDCLHDMTDPAAVVRQIRAATRPDGVWLVCEMRARETYEENVEKNPMAAMMYGTSVLTCMSSALSEADGAGLDTLGMPASLLRRMAEEAGFTRFEPLDLDHPVNAFYVLRP